MYCLEVTYYMKSVLNIGEYHIHINNGRCRHKQEAGGVGRLSPLKFLGLRCSLSNNRKQPVSG